MPPAGRGLEWGPQNLGQFAISLGAFSQSSSLASARARAPPLSARVSSAARASQPARSGPRTPRVSSSTGFVRPVPGHWARPFQVCHRRAGAGSSGRKSDMTPLKPPIHRASCGHLEGPAAARRSATPTLGSGVLALGAARWWRLLISTRRPLPPCASRAPPSRRHFRHTHLAACRFASTARHTGGWLLPSSDT